MKKTPKTSAKTQNLPTNDTNGTAEEGTAKGRTALTEDGERVPPIDGDAPCEEYDPAGPGAGVEPDGHPQCANCGHPKSLHGSDGSAGAAPIERSEKMAGTARWQEFVRVPLEKLVVSPTQPRKTFPELEQKELEESMREHGFDASISSLILRPCGDAYFLEPGAEEGLLELCRRGADGVVVREGTMPRKEAEVRLRESTGLYEIIMGERRVRAARMVGLRDAPALIVLMDDEEVERKQLVEVTQREGLTPLDEAGAYQRMLGKRDAEGRPVYTYASLAKQLGKKPKLIERRAALARLTGKTRAAVESGFLPASTAVLIASIPDERLREEAAKMILEPKHEPAPLSKRRAVEVIKQSFICDLRDAAFDQADETLVPVEVDSEGQRCAGGSCRDCPLRTGNLEKLVDGEEGGPGLKSAQHNLCMNPSCFQRKKAESYRRWMEKETDPAKKRRALSEEESKRIFQFGDQLHYASGLVDLHQHPDSDQLKPGVETAPKWKQLVKGAEVEVLVAVDRNGKAHELVRKEEAVAAAELGGTKLFRDSAKEPAKSQDERKEEEMVKRRAAEVAGRIEDAKRKALVEKVMGTKKLPEGFWPLFLEYGCGEIYWGDIAERRGLPEEEFYAGLIAGTDQQIIAALVEYGSEGSWMNGKQVESLPKWGKLFGVDLKEAEKAAKAAIKVEEAAEAEAAEIAAGMVWATQREEPGEFLWEADATCSNPDVCELAFKKSMHLYVCVYVARHENGFVSGFGVADGKKNVEEPCRSTGPFFSSRGLALEKGIFSAKAALAQMKPAESAMARLEAYQSLVIGALEVPAKRKKGGK